MADKAVLWDFDGTLADRVRNWARAVATALRDHAPEVDIEETVDRLKSRLYTGFPWHKPEEPHTHLDTADKWWGHIRHLIASHFRTAGFDPEAAERLAHATHLAFLDPEGYVAYDDAIPTLVRLSSEGWRHGILSNHVPELEVYVEHTGLRPHVDAVMPSALIGYEKPHPEVFDYARERMGNPPVLWMVGDNPRADIAGAEAAGIPAILVHTDAPATRRASTLAEAGEIILASEA